MAAPSILMSYPGPRWHIRGGVNFRSQARRPTNPRQAAKEWAALADAISDAGAQVVVMPPADRDPPLTGMIFTANAGAFFGDVFWVSQMFVEHRKDEAPFIQSFVRSLGVSAQVAPSVWEGQADITTLPHGAGFVLTWGVRTVRESCDRVRQALPEGARTLDVQIRDPYFHGDTCLSAFDTPRGALLLAFEGALVDSTLEDLRRFAPQVEVVPISEGDALAYACNALAVGGRWLCPQGVSDELKKRISDAGLQVVELGFEELFGKGGGGPRCQVNHLDAVAPFPTPPGQVTWTAQRRELLEAFAAYPETA